jgi:Tfp pilus assembly protein PilV
MSNYVTNILCIGFLLFATEQTAFGFDLKQCKDTCNKEACVGLDQKTCETAVYKCVKKCYSTCETDVCKGDIDCILDKCSEKRISAES